jgi:hypothetical protein
VTLQVAAEELRTLECARLDHYLRKLRSHINRGSFRAIESALKVATRRARLLGLDAPERRENTNRNAGPDWDNMDEEQLRAELARSWRDLSEDTRKIIKEVEDAAGSAGMENPQDGEKRP